MRQSSSAWPARKSFEIDCGLDPSDTPAIADAIHNLILDITELERAAALSPAGALEREELSAAACFLSCVGEAIATCQMRRSRRSMDALASGPRRDRQAARPRESFRPIPEERDDRTSEKRTKCPVKFSRPPISVPSARTKGESEMTALQLRQKRARLAEDAACSSPQQEPLVQRRPKKIRRMMFECESLKSERCSRAIEAGGKHAIAESTSRSRAARDSRPREAPSSATVTTRPIDSSSATRRYRKAFGLLVLSPQRIESDRTRRPWTLTTRTARRPYSRHDRTARHGCRDGRDGGYSFLHRLRAQRRIAMKYYGPCSRRSTIMDTDVRTAAPLAER